MAWAGAAGRFWREASLVRRFAVAGGLVMLAGALVIGSWVESRIERGVIRQSATATAHYLEAIIAPLAQELDKGESLSPGPRRALEELLASPPVRSRIASFKIWKDGGRVVWATDPDLIGRRFPVGDDLRAAWEGAVAADFADFGKDESEAEAALGVSLIEIYSPLREAWTGRVIAVMEFYEIAGPLEAELAAARRTSWLVVAAVMLVMAAALFGIVDNGSKLIAAQRRLLERQVADLGRLARQNLELRMRVQRASAGAAETNERYLSRIGADLHDGPVQLLSLAALRLDSLERPRPEAEQAAEVRELRSALTRAVNEIRDVSRGLALPDLAGRPLAEVVRRAVDIHRSLTRTEVEVAVPEAGPLLPHPQLIAIYRFVQEALSNATRHGGGVGMRVAVETADGRVSVVVSDRGPGLAGPLAEDRPGLGLRGLAERIESLGGSFAIEPGEGCGVTLRLVLAPQEEAHVA
jgi:hypothetical protein